MDAQAPNVYASREQIATVEAVLGVRFPADVVASYLVHDGQLREYGLFDGWSLRSLKSIVRTWRSQIDHPGLGVFTTFLP